MPTAPRRAVAASPRAVARGCALGAAAALAAASSCTRVSDTERFASRDEPLLVVETVPPAGARAVPTHTAIDLCFSHLVDPRSIAAADARLSSGLTEMDSEASLQLLPWTGPGGSDPFADGTDAPWCDGSVLAVQPSAVLLPGLRYRLRLVPRARGWSGERLDTAGPGWTAEGELFRYYLEFTTDPAPEPVRERPEGVPTVGPTLSALFGAGGVFDPARPVCSCHRDPADLAAERLDLRSVDAAYAALVLDARLRETGFPLVSPRRPSESFLVHKLLRDHDGLPLRGVLGDAMPPDDELPYPDYVAIAQWIAAGALK